MLCSVYYTYIYSQVRKYSDTDRIFVFLHLVHHCNGFEMGQKKNVIEVQTFGFVLRVHRDMTFAIWELQPFYKNCLHFQELNSIWTVD